MRTALLTFAILLGGSAFACEEPPTEQRVSPGGLIARSNNIVLALVTSGEVRSDGRVLYTFREVLRLSGTPLGTFTLLGRSGVWDDDNQTFDHHSDPLFWTEAVGRTPNDTGCQIDPSFSVGGTYLLFLDKPYHVKSFELIIHTNGDAPGRDRWLQFVVESLSRQARPDGDGLRPGGRR